MLIPSDRLRSQLEIIPAQFSARIFNDGHLGGNSVVQWVDKAAQIWQCELRDTYHTPFCSIQVTVTDTHGKGIDLQNYDKLTVYLNYEGDATHLRLYLRNRHPSYYVPGQDMSTKYNVVEFPVRNLDQGLKLSSSDFTVANWWLTGGNIPLENAHPEFNEISIIELQTGSMDRSGVHRIQLQKLVWSAPLLTQAQLYQTVILLWVCYIIGIAMHRIVMMKLELNRNIRYQRELMSTNAALNLDCRHYEDLAKTDALTGVSNRVGIRDILHAGLVEWRACGTPFSLIFIDLDFFKRINDAFGHDAGDKVLQALAGLMQNNVRNTDTLARWGGEEFVLVCPNTTIDCALRAAEHLRSCIAAHLTYQNEKITASFGVATMSEPSLDHLFKKADDALYKAKQLGRNRVCCESMSVKPH